MSELLQDRIEAATPNFTRSEAKLANFVLANPDCLLFSTAAEVASRNDLSPMSVSRFIQKIGFASMSELRKHLRKETFGPRMPRYSDRFEKRRRIGDAQASLEAESFAIRRAYQMRDAPQWGEAVQMLAQSDAVYVSGMLALHHLADAMVTHLSYIRPDVSMVTRMSGTFIAPLTSQARSKVLVIINIFRYGKEGPELAQFARERGTKVILICDERCDWSAASADCVLPVAVDLGLFMSSTVSVYSMINLLIHDVADMLGTSASEVLETASEAQERFGAFMD